MKKYTELPDKITVKQAADFLILTHGCATADTVRNRLTEQGFSLTLPTVSALLELIAEEQGWDNRRKSYGANCYSLPLPKNESAWFSFSLN